MGRYFIFSLLFFFIALPFILALQLFPDSKEKKTHFHSVSFSDLQGWKNDDMGEAFLAFLKSCNSLSDNPEGKNIKKPCQLARDSETLVQSDPSQARLFFERIFRPYLVSVGDNQKALLTGYYQPIIEGSLEPDPTYLYPLYRLPDDLVTVDLKSFHSELSGRLMGRIENGRLVPYHDRAAIAGGVLDGRGLEIVWAKSALDVFFLQIQGSGGIRLADGKTLLVGYAGGNGHMYTSIGKILIAKGYLSKNRVSMFTIRDWLERNPTRSGDILNQNASYVFFHVLDGEQVVGSAGAPLTAMRSLATDNDNIPLGYPLWVETELPDHTPLNRLLVAQDTGSAIKGALRGDLFFGSGKTAEWHAGHMKSNARFYVLLPVQAP